MNKNIAKIFVAIKDNAVVAIGTNLKELHEDFSKLVSVWSYTQLYNSFREAKSFSKTTTTGETYYFQVFENQNQ